MSSRNNSELVEAILSLMFETLWVAPYDRRRGNPLLAEFERCGHNAVRLLSGTDLFAAASGEVRAAAEAVEMLHESVRRMAQAGLFSPDRVASVLSVAGHVSDAVHRACACETRCK